MPKDYSIDILEETALDELIETLQVAKQIGFSLSHFPAEVLLDVMIDCALQLKNQFREGAGFWKDRINPELQFLEKPIKLHKPERRTWLIDASSGRREGYFTSQLSDSWWGMISDELGNPQQVRIHKTSEQTASPQISKFFKDLSQTLVKMKLTHKLPKDFASNGNEERQHPTSKISPETYWYLKRRKSHLKNKRNHPDL